MSNQILTIMSNINFGALIVPIMVILLVIVATKIARAKYKGRTD
jgi:hypothetical protein